MIYSFCTYIKESKRVDLYLSALFGDFSRAYIQKMIDKGQVQINKKVVNKNIKIKNKDEVSLEIQLEKLDVNAEDMNLQVVYEDQNIIVVNKDPGVNSHPVPGENGKTGTLVNALLFHTTDLASIGGVERPGIVHRLDKDTSGLIMVAKNDSMMHYLQDIIQKREVDKYYLAIVSGIVKENNMRIESFIGRHPVDKIKMTTKNPINGKIAITNVELLDYIDDKYSLLLVKIETGRTHQIRVHLSSIGFPIIGDKVYGNLKVNKEVETKYGLTRQALHSYKLSFNLYEKKVEFIAPLKADMQKIIGDKIK
ncbi:MAG: RluA family pseudouridine synthase [Candidatus Gracilibacteria bacterium]|nr:RluA family pseudouridine synthase [Candidatus Gracilibacteria bacterium]